MQHQYLTTNGIQLHYVTAGEGPLMLFLHGFPEFWYSWRHQINEFAKDYKVIAIDMRGYNDSDKPKEKSAYVMSEFVKDVEGVITALGYERCVLVAHDWGGAIAWQFAYACPDRLTQLIVLNLPHPAKFAAGLRTLQQLRRSWYIAFFQLPILPELALKANNYEGIRAAFRDTAINPKAFTEADLDALVAAAAKPSALTSMLNYYRNIFSGSFFNQQWDVLHIPTLMIWGENDVALGKELTHGTEEYVSDLTLHYIPNCSHWVQQEQPELVNQYIKAFIT
ncbi:MAG: alpha/beta hydrolase [Cyanobacteria bacterium J06581_3]